MHLPEPARPHDLRQGASIVAIGLVRHGLHGGVRAAIRHIAFSFGTYLQRQDDICSPMSSLIDDYRPL